MASCPGVGRLLLLCGLLALSQVGGAATAVGGRRGLLAATTPPSSDCIDAGGSCVCSTKLGVEYVGGDLQAANGNLITAQTDIQGCCLGCSQLKDCYAWTYKNKLCFFKGATGYTVANTAGVISGKVLNKTAPVVEPSPGPLVEPAPGPEGWLYGPEGAPAPAPGPGGSEGGYNPPLAPANSFPTQPGCVNGPNGACTCWEEPNVEYQGGDLQDANGNLITTPFTQKVPLGACCTGCATLKGCAAWTFKSGVCYFKGSSGWTNVTSPGVVSGTVLMGQTPPAAGR